MAGMMMMYRTTQQSLLIQSSSSRSTKLCLSSSLILYRHRSNKSGTTKFAQLIEVDLASSSSDSSSSSSATSASTADDNMAATGVRKLEDVIYNIIVRRSAPDWLPFLPGSSYWVPPRRRSRAAGSSLVDIIGNLSLSSSSSSMRTHDEETLSMSSVRGWPSSAFFIHGSSPARPLPVDVQVVEVKFQEESENESQSEDDSDH